MEGDGNGLLGTSVDAHDVTEGSLGALQRNSAEIVLSFCTGSACFSQQSWREV